jgi:protein ImuB
MKRIVSLWLPHFPTDRLTRPRGPLGEFRQRPLATVTRAQGGIRVAAANVAAQEAGVAPGLPAADAQAVCPGLKTVVADPAAEAAGLVALAEWCRRWSPWTAPEGTRGLWLDVSGCAHLFGGEAALLDDMLARVGALGLSGRGGLADTPGAAWAAARFGEEPATIVPPGAARQWLAAWPVAALRLSSGTADTLRRLGLRRIEDLLGLPRAGLAARFGDEVAHRLDQMLGRLPEPISPLPADEPLFARLAFAEPIARTSDVEHAIGLLLGRLCRQLERRGLGARRLELRLFRVDGSTQSQAVGTALPERDPSHLSRLFRGGLDRLDAGFGIEAMTLAAPQADPFAAAQGDVEARSAGAGLALVMDRLARRLGEDRVHRLAPRPTHTPERLAGRIPPLGDVLAAWPALRRPVRLLPRPEAVAVEERNGVPRSFSHRGRHHALAAAEGPERIAAEWWHAAAPPSPEVFRDYWRVEADIGGRFWLFREGHGSRWFMHGSFA